MVDFYIQFQNKRVGSTFLQNAIDSHKDLAGVDECFVNMAKKQGMRKSGFVPYLRSDAQTPKDYIDNIIKKTHYDKKGISMKLMYNQVHYHSGLMQYIQNQNVPMIHLMRRNIAKQIVSGLNAATTEHKPISIKPKQFLTLVKDAHKANEYWSKNWKKHIKLTLYYEDIIGETVEDKTYLAPNANVAVCDFFGIPQVQLYAKTKKKNKEDLSVYLPNLDEIKELFKSTKFKWMLEGEK